MEDSKSVLLQQIEDWRTRLKEARDALRVAEAVLPKLEESLKALEDGEAPKRFKVASLPIADPDEVLAPNEEDKEDENGFQVVPTSGVTQVQDAKEVQVAISKTVTALPHQFRQADVEAGLASQGLVVNRSTLRSNLLILARVREGFEILEEGRGRKATIFQRV